MIKLHPLTACSQHRVLPVLTAVIHGHLVITGRPRVFELLHICHLCGRPLDGGRGVWPNADKSGQGGGRVDFFTVFLRTSFMEDPIWTKLTVYELI